MARSAAAVRIARNLLGLAVAFASAAPSPAETRLTLEELGRRQAPSYATVYEGRKVAVRGVVSAVAYHFKDYTLLPIEAGGAGGLLKVAETDRRLDGFVPGDEVEAAGTVVVLYGVPMVVPDSLTVQGRKPAPQPVALSPKAAQDLHYVGRLVRTEGTVYDTGYNAGGALVLIAAAPGPLKLFIPRPPGKPQADLSGFRKGDVVRVSGVGLQYAPVPPYNTGFELLVSDPGEVLAIERSGPLSPTLVGAGICVVLVGGFLFWSRERRLRSQRKKLRKTYQVGEDILSAPSAAAILGRLAESLPSILGVTRVRLYLHNRTARTLDAVVEDGSKPVSISLSAPPGGSPAGAVACFHYRTLLAIPDISRSPFPLAGEGGLGSPKSLLYVPMMAQSDVVGVLELDQDDRAREFSTDEQALAQHLGNQIGVAIRLQDQRSVQEQLYRSEKLAAVGRLISSVVNELQTPLASIADLAQRALEKVRGGPAEREVAAIGSEAAKAGGMVTRLVSFASHEQVEARPVDISALLRSLIDFRHGDCKASGIRVRDLTSAEPQIVLGSPGQLEQLFLNLMVHAEQSLAQAETKLLTIRSSLLARRVLVEISFSAPFDERKPEETAAVLGVTRSVIAGHGGEIRLIEKAGAEPRFEIELPAQVKERGAKLAAPATQPRDPSRRLTVLVIEPDDAAQRQLLALLSARGCRVVPVGNTDTALDLAQRMRFDAVFCSLHAPGLNWVELSERMHDRVAAFSLLSDGYDTELSADFEGDGRWVLPKPVQETELDRILKAAEPRGATIIPFKTGTA